MATKAVRTPEQRAAARKAYRERQLDRVDFVGFTEKHETRYFSFGLVKDKVKRWGEICLAIAQERLSEGYYPEEPPELPPAPEPIDQSKDSIEVIEKKLEAIKNRKYLEDKTKQDREVYALVARVRKDDADAAMDLIELCRDGEYEGYDFHHFETV